MSEDSNYPQSPTPPTRNRRSSFAGQTFADLFGTGRARPSNENSPPQTAQYPGPISQAAARAQSRRLSLTTLGISGASGSTSPFNSYRGRRESAGSANSGSYDESAIAEDDEPNARDMNNGSTPATPFARRTSFGAKALRDIRRGSLSGGMGANEGMAGQNGSNEGFNWSDNFRNRAERASIGGQGTLFGGAGGGGGSGGLPAASHSRAKSVATMEPPVKAMPPPKEPGRPDHFQERILKGDFYMD